MRWHLFGTMTDKPPVCWPRTCEAIYLGDGDESRCVIIERLRNGFQPGEIDVFDCPRIWIKGAIDRTGACALSFRGRPVHIIVSQGEHKMSGLDAPSPGLTGVSCALRWKNDCIVSIISTQISWIDCRVYVTIIGQAKRYAEDVPGRGSVHGHCLSALERPGHSPSGQQG